jgi:predicted nucleic acid-binding protein
MSPVIVDSCCWIDRLRGGRDIRQELLPLLRAGMLYNCGVIRAEVLRGIQSEQARDGLGAFFDIIPEIPCDAKMWREVSRVAWDLARREVHPPIPDLMIAQSSLRVGAVLVTFDAHFDEIPGLRLSKDLPLGP